MEFEMPTMPELNPANVHTVKTVLNFDAPVEISMVESAPVLHLLNVEKLRNGISHFRFTKKDGSVREAFGTLNAQIMPARIGGDAKAFQDGLSRSSATSQSFFDLVAQDWRAYVINNIVTVL